MTFSVDLILEIEGIEKNCTVEGFYEKAEPDVGIMTDRTILEGIKLASNNFLSDLSFLLENENYYDYVLEQLAESRRSEAESNYFD